MFNIYIFRLNFSVFEFKDIYSMNLNFLAIAIRELEIPFSHAIFVISMSSDGNDFSIWIGGEA
ncbi:hypothetical protein D3C81_1973320 [compost metagenome]